MEPLQEGQSCPQYGEFLTTEHVDGKQVTFQYLMIHKDVGGRAMDLGPEGLTSSLGMAGVIQSGQIRYP